jgi:hypothetical protein
MTTLDLILALHRATEAVDAAHKATLMSALAFGIPVQFSKRALALDAQ